MSKKHGNKDKAHEEALVEVDPVGELAQLRSSFDQVLGRMFRGHWQDAWNAGWGCDVEDEDNEIVVRAEAPGFEPDEIDVQLSGNRLVIQAEHKSETNGENDKSKLSKYGKLYRAMTVPDGIEPNQVAANYRNGILEVRLPKGEGIRTKRIAVNAAS